MLPCSMSRRTIFRPACCRRAAGKTTYYFCLKVTPENCCNLSMETPATDLIGLVRLSKVVRRGSGPELSFLLLFLLSYRHWSIGLFGLIGLHRPPELHYDSLFDISRNQSWGENITRSEDFNFYRINEANSWLLFSCCRCQLFMQLKERSVASSHFFLMFCQCSSPDGPFV